MTPAIAVLLLSDCQFYDPTMNNTTRDLIKEWLTPRGYTVGKTASKPGVQWMLDAEQASGFRIHVGVVDTLPDSIIIMASVNTSDYQLHIRSLTPEKRRDLLFKLRFRLLAVEGIKFDLPEDISKLQVSAEIFIEALTRAGFWNAVAQIGKALSCASWTLEQEFDPVRADSNGAGH